MLTREPDAHLIEEWKEVWREYRDKLRPNRRNGREIAEYLRSKYVLTEIRDGKARRVVVGNVLGNAHYAEKLPEGSAPSPVAFYVEDAGAGKRLYENRDAVFQGMRIFVGIDLLSGYYCVEGSESLWDELCAFQGLDDNDIQNAFLVAQYVACLRRFGLPVQTRL